VGEEDGLMEYQLSDIGYAIGYVILDLLMLTWTTVLAVEDTVDVGNAARKWRI
jgi:hypothetical protein